MLRVALAGHIRRVIVDAAGVVIDMGRRQRLFTGAAREAAKLLVQHCEHPGCELPAEFCDVDHADEWADGGPTDLANAGIRCGSHNVDKSKRGWQRAVNGRRYTIRSDGTVMLPVGGRTPTFSDDDDDDDVAENPVEIERLNVIIRQRASALTAA